MCLIKSGIPNLAVHCNHFFLIFKRKPYLGSIPNIHSVGLEGDSCLFIFFGGGVVWKTLCFQYLFYFNLLFILIFHLQLTVNFILY